MASSSSSSKTRPAGQRSHHSTQLIRRIGLTTEERRLLGASWRQLLRRLHLQMRTGAAEAYQVVPARPEESGRQFVLLLWRIELHGLRGRKSPLGLDIGGDAVLGRGVGSTGPAPDVDLDSYGASAEGVSRRHVLLRPTKNHLYLIDLNSRNGVWINGVRLGVGRAHPIQNLDTVTLGKLTFQVKIIDAPAMERVPRVRAHLLEQWPPPEPDSSS